MEKPTITIDGNIIPIKTLTGADWRILGEFLNEDIKPSQADYIEKHATFIAHFFDGVTSADILKMPLEDIMPLVGDIQKYFTATISGKLDEISKNAEPGNP